MFTNCAFSAYMYPQSGNTRFGVIYFKPDEQRYQQLSSWPPLSPSSSTPRVSSPSTCMAGGPSLIDMPHLLHDYYRSVFNTFLSIPFTFQSDHSSHSSQTSDNDSCRSRSTSSASESNELNQKDIFDSITAAATGDTEPNKNRKSTRVNHLAQISPALMDVGLLNKVDIASPNRKAFPGMATRLSSAII